MWKHLETVSVDFQHNRNRDVQEQQNPGIDVHGPVVISVEDQVERRAVSRLYYVIQAKQSGEKHRKHTEYTTLWRTTATVCTWMGKYWNLRNCLSNNKSQSGNKIWVKKKIVFQAGLANAHMQSHTTPVCGWL